MAEEAETLVTSSPLYKDRSEWKDIKPIYFTEDEEGAVKIAVSDAFRDAFAYLRAILQINEYSDRALELTTTCTQLNPANYTVWQFRRNVLKALEKDISEELRFCEETIFENPKNYQVWHHRRVLVEWLKDGSKELDFTQEILLDDAKNYHAWQHRQWVVDNFNYFNQAELDFSLKMLCDDLRNNSAWNYRFFIVSRLSNHLKDSEVIGQEVKFCLQCIKKVPGNERYRDNEIANREKSSHLLSFMVDIILELLEKKQDVKENMDRAIELLEELKIIDPIRRKYWSYQELLVQNLASSAS
uniref:Protein farnesyltransferase/geranylgeranyltransferase type-1 subunit alpha n=1 Tax=Acrobeloides nanus TaxID=290746 RepID=A0A914E0P3_9BILA